MGSKVFENQCSWLFVFPVSERKLLWKVIDFLDLFCVYVKFPNKLMLMFTLFFPIPTLHLKLTLTSISEEFACRNFKRFPIRAQIVHNDLCSGSLQKRVVGTNFQKFQVGVAFVPKVKERVSIHEFMTLPLHLIEN